jgi:hypothetical protein
LFNGLVSAGSGLLHFHFPLVFAIGVPFSSSRASYFNLIGLKPRAGSCSAVYDFSACRQEREPVLLLIITTSPLARLFLARAPIVQKGISWRGV